MMDPLPPRLPADGVRCKKTTRLFPDALRGSVRAGHASQQPKAQQCDKNTHHGTNCRELRELPFVSSKVKDIKHFHAFSRFTTKRLSRFGQNLRPVLDPIDMSDPYLALYICRSSAPTASHQIDSN